nr:immunoglobulin heavy chain junction region [Mus musculus]MBK4195673.1 immunoglobulin heavy chain junction region [Mus musculus]MBK4195674.1 immunoglobulin heavy chain junction region [Mus musculus]MBK4195675.1 immunoglobulin heavy chain junction region [Mus musculus]MBK4195676.1 immunoglobulin heavy chain junction region [Mus musculus]
CARSAYYSNFDYW